MRSPVRVSVLTNAILITGVLSVITGLPATGLIGYCDADRASGSGTITVTIILYVTNRKLASEVAYYSGLVLMAVTAYDLGGMMFIVLQPDAIRKMPFASVIDQAIRMRLNKAEECAGHSGVEASFDADAVTSPCTTVSLRAASRPVRRKAPGARSPSASPALCAGHDEAAAKQSPSQV
jgi:hypothetical protein